MAALTRTKGSASLVQKLQSAFGCSGENVLTCVRARSGAITLHRGGVAIYSFDGVDILAGDIILFASATEWGECAFLTAWTRAADRKHDFWKFAITDDVVRVPVRMLIASTAAFIGERAATIVCPPALYCPLMYSVHMQRKCTRAEQVRRPPNNNINENDNGL